MAFSRLNFEKMQLLHPFSVEFEDGGILNGYVSLIGPFYWNCYELVKFLKYSNLEDFVEICRQIKASSLLVQEGDYYVSNYAAKLTSADVGSDNAKLFWNLENVSVVDDSKEKLKLKSFKESDTKLSDVLFTYVMSCRRRCLLEKEEDQLRIFKKLDSHPLNLKTFMLDPSDKSTSWWIDVYSRYKYLPTMSEPRIESDNTHPENKGLYFIYCENEKSSNEAQVASTNDNISLLLEAFLKNLENCIDEPDTLKCEIDKIEYMIKIAKFNLLCKELNCKIKVIKNKNGYHLTTCVWSNDDSLEGTDNCRCHMKITNPYKYIVPKVRILQQLIDEPEWHDDQSCILLYKLKDITLKSFGNNYDKCEGCKEREKRQKGFDKKMNERKSISN